MKHWYALYTKPHKEHQVSSILESQGFKTYLPTIQVRKNSRRKTRPFFSCYLFIRMDPVDALPEVRWTPGLRRIVSFGQQPAIVFVNDDKARRFRLVDGIMLACQAVAGIDIQMGTVHQDPTVRGIVRSDTRHGPQIQ